MAAGGWGCGDRLHVDDDAVQWRKGCLGMWEAPTVKVPSLAVQSPRPRRSPAPRDAGVSWVVYLRAGYTSALPDRVWSTWSTLVLPCGRCLIWGSHFPACRSCSLDMDSTTTSSYTSYTVHPASSPSIASRRQHHQRIRPYRLRACWQKWISKEREKKKTMPTPATFVHTLAPLHALRDIAA